MTTTSTSRRATLAAVLAAGVLLLGACGDGDEDAKDNEEAADENQAPQQAEDEVRDSSIPEPSVNPDAPAAGSEFCEGALAAMTVQPDPNDPANDAGLDAAEQLDPPDEIAEAWTNVITTSREMSEVDFSDPEASTKAMEAFQEVEDDQAKVIAYLQDDCGIEVGAPSDGSTVTTGG